MPRNKELPDREAMCRTLADKLEDAELARVFPDFAPEVVRAVLKGEMAVSARETPQKSASQAQTLPPASGVHSGFCQLFTDGASRGNPGHAGAGAALLNEHGEELALLTEYLGVCTNNVAEYKALILGLEAALRQGCQRVALRMDSELVARQLEGRYKVKHEQLKPLYDTAMGLLARFQEWQVRHVPRSDNALADRLANEGIDSRVH